MKNYAFIDGNNLFYGVKSLGFVMDFAKFRKFLFYKHKVVKAYYFIGLIKGNEPLYNRLTSAGYDLVFKETTKTKTGYKGNCDAELVLFAMKELKNYQKAVIVSSDGDFRCLVEYLEELNKLENVIGVKNNFSHLLAKATTKITFLDNIRHKVKK